MADIIIDCRLTIAENDAVTRALYHVEDDAVAINGYVYPFGLVGKFTLTPDVPWITISVEALTGTFSLGGGRAVGFVQSDTLTGTFTLSADFYISRVAETADPTFVYDGTPDPTSTNWLAWSKIGSVEINFDLTNDAGYRPMDWEGQILNILQLGKSAVVYGTGGITVVYPVSSPIATFGFKNIHDVGIAYKLAVSGNDKVHYFLSTRFELCEVTEKGITILGYEEMLSTLGLKTVLTFDKVNRRLYISDGVSGFVFTNGGLGGSGLSDVTGVYNKDVTSQLVFPNTPVQPGFEFWTDIITLKSRVLKTLSKVSIETDCSVPMYCSVGYRIHRSDDWSWTEPRLFNLEGIATVAVSGIEFILKISTDSWEEITIDKLYLRWKLTDKRHRFEYNPNALYSGGNKSVVPTGVSDADTISQ